MLQGSYFPALSRKYQVLKFKGGTDVDFQPTINFVSDQLEPQFRETLGLGFNTVVLQRGFFPKGGGEVEFRMTPGEGDTYFAVKDFDWTKQYLTKHSSHGFFGFGASKQIDQVLSVKVIGSKFFRDRMRTDVLETKEFADKILQNLPQDLKKATISINVNGEDSFKNGKKVE